LTAAIAADGARCAPFLHRGRALAALGRDGEAECDLCTCLTLSKLEDRSISRAARQNGIAACRHTRGLLRMRAGRCHAALADLDAAVAASTGSSDSGGDGGGGGGGDGGDGGGGNIRSRSGESAECGHNSGRDCEGGDCGGGGGGVFVCSGRELWERRWHRAMCLLELGRPDAAYNDMLAAEAVADRQHDRKTWRLRYHIGLACLGKWGDAADAVYWFDRALAPPSPQGGSHDAETTIDASASVVGAAEADGALHYHRGLALSALAASAATTAGNDGNNGCHACQLTFEAERAFSGALLLGLPPIHPGGPVRLLSGALPTAPPTADKPAEATAPAAAHGLTVACRRERARCRQTLRRLRDAAVDLDAALELAPGDASIYFQRGWVRK
ncbi:unnamed protein product, partial [Phaeothamnion confervicola]